MWSWVTWKKKKTLSFRSMANLLSKGSCELVWPQVFQGMQRLNIFPIFPSASLQRIAHNLRIKMSRKVLVARKVLHYTTRSIGEYIWLLSIPGDVLPASTILLEIRISSGSLFFKTSSSASPPNTVFLLETPLRQSHHLPLFVHLHKLLVLIPSTACNVNDNRETNIIHWSLRS